MEIKLKNYNISNDNKFFLIGGPCVIEDEKMIMETAEKLKKITEELDIFFVFKSSYDKANRSSIKSFRGPGINKGLKILEKVKNQLDLPILTDVHSPQQAKIASDVVDIIQIPAFLSRQTDLVVEAAKTGKIVNIKKGQFLAPWDMEKVLNKALASGTKNVILTERGACFGYNNLISDMTALEVMKNFGYPVVFDATHSVQKPGGLGDRTGGNREFVYPLAKSALSIGISGLFMEIHPEPKKAKSDGPNMVRLDDVKEMLNNLKKLDNLIKEEKI
ncbi:MAG: 3-deoxy-8-phosphooctulonate synthase [Candidatus Mcinerneyibacterium aminivorans]|jgi:2-dehydro-3-deoxyphosphooctonate aldolase (KDO 8-P synthase)|uniref:2-dehydro-3-deoxyphosphooctonate aldolase n=1 Tax=Candidatus Mcinerneyibacterium aminivorans TaxID=2703815 RepID=A0A5D0MF66_9BACT|nr:MAG: 3-deoxy-8-phosphooctulonate synthase [Candidatus Mcinerneyibacterium aminivorans]